MSKYKRQHTITESYLKGFVDSARNQLCQYRKCDGTVSWLSTNDATIAKYIYSFRERDGTWNHTAEELLGHIEANAMPVMRKIQSKQEILEQERFDFSMFVAAMIKRPRHMMEHFDDAVRTFSEGPASMMSIFDRELENLRKRFSEEEIASVEHRIRRGEVKSNLDAAKAAHLRVWFENLPRHALGMANMYWEVWKADKDCYFITSDAPAVVRREGQPNDLGIVGIENTRVGAELTFPLSRSHLLMMKHSPCPERRKATKTRVRELNSLVVRMSGGFIFAREESESLKRLVLENNYFEPPLPNFMAAYNEPSLAR